MQFPILFGWSTGTSSEKLGESNCRSILLVSLCMQLFHSVSTSNDLFYVIPVLHASMKIICVAVHFLIKILYMIYTYSAHVAINTSIVLLMLDIQLCCTNVIPPSKNLSHMNGKWTKSTWMPFQTSARKTRIRMTFSRENSSREGIQIHPQPRTWTSSFLMHIVKAPVIHHFKLPFLSAAKSIVS